jgi:dTDP-4-dehydrorhamnose reductase
VIVNCAALTDVDRCEERREEAMETNGSAVAGIAGVADAIGAGLIQISTDYVFDGVSREPYPEDAPPAPISVYGESKLLGEEAALGAQKGLVVRTSWLFGPGGRNFVTTIIGLLDAGRDPLEVVDDQVGCPTYAPFLANAILDLAPLGVTGRLHYRNGEPASWHGFASEIARIWNPETRVRAVATADVPRPAARPAYSVLDVEQVEKILGRGVEPWMAGLTTYLNRLRVTRN